MVYRSLKTSILGMVAGASMIFGANASYAGDWKPEKPITMVIMAGQGGGADRIARLFQSIIQKENLSTCRFCLLIRVVVLVLRHFVS